MSRRPRRVLVGMGETAGWCAGVVAGLRALGCRADHLNLGADPMGYGTEPPSPAVRAVRWLGERRRLGPGPHVAWTALHRVALGWLFLHALLTYDAFVFRAGDSFFALRDLALLRRLRRPTLVVFFGTDSRPPYLSGPDLSRGPSGVELAAETRARRRMVERTEREATAIVCHVMSAQLHSRRSIAFLAVGIPRSVPALVAPFPPTPPVRVLHAPSRSAGKGTDLVIAAVDAARAAGADVELEIVSGVPNAQVLAAIERSHFVIDQVFSDTPMAGFAAEAAARGRAAIVGGLGWDELRAVTPEEHLPPAHLCRPDELAAAVAQLATDAAYREALGARARDFVAERWSPAAVAERLLDALAGDAAADATFMPAEVSYPHGAGLDVAGATAGVRAVLEAAGPTGLRVGDKPELERRLLELIAEPDLEAIG